MSGSLDALLSMHSGSVRPDYALAGTQWADTSVAGKISVKLYDGTADRVLYVINTATGEVTFGDAGSLLHIRDQKASGTPGGSAVAGVQARSLNTVVTNTIAGASLSANQITLAAGTYDVEAFAPAWRVDGSKVWLRIAGAGTVLLEGASVFGASVDGTIIPYVKGRITLSESTVIELAHHTTLSTSSVGLGQPASIAGRPEIYAEAFFKKVA
jgi:hypothetical protein